MDPSTAAQLDRDVRLRIYRHLIATGRAPDAAALAGTMDRPVREIEESYLRLDKGRGIVLRPRTVEIWMAHPFSAIPTLYRVVAAGKSYWANCAWDALGIPAILGEDSISTALCGDCGIELNLSVTSGGVSNNTGVVHFAVQPRKFWEDIGYT